MKLPQRRRFRFSLWTCLVFMTVCAVVLGLFGNRLYKARKQRGAVDAIKSAVGFVEYDQPLKLTNVSPISPGLPRISYYGPPKPSWYEQLLGKDFFHDVIRISFYEHYDANPVIPRLADCPYVQQVSLPAVPLTEVSLDVLRKLPRLKKITWRGVCPPTQAIEMATRLDRVEELGLANCKLVNDEHMRLIARMTALRELNVSDSSVTDAGLTHLAQLPNLETLFVNGTAITDRGMKTLAALPKLSSLDAGGTEITNDGLAFLAAAPRLEALSLNDTLITDAGLEHLKRLPLLRRVSLEANNLSHHAVERLRAALPDCTIDFTSRAPAKR